MAENTKQDNVVLHVKEITAGKGAKSQLLATLIPGSTKAGKRTYFSALPEEKRGSEPVFNVLSVIPKKEDGPTKLLTVRQPGAEESEIITGLFETKSKAGNIYYSGSDKEAGLRYYVFGEMKK